MSSPSPEAETATAGPTTDVADPAAHDKPPRPRTWPERVLRATSWLAALWGLAVLDLWSQPGRSWLLELIVLPTLALVLATVWLAVLTFSRRAQRTPLRHRVAAPMLVGLGTIATIVMPYPPENPLFRLRFELSRPALTSAATQLREDDPDRPRLVGLFLVQETMSSESEVWFITSNCSIFCGCGVAFSPDGPPEVDAEDVLQPLGEDWYRIVECI